MLQGGRTVHSPKWVGGARYADVRVVRLCTFSVPGQVHGACTTSCKKCAGALPCGCGNGSTRCQRVARGAMRNGSAVQVRRSVATSARDSRRSDFVADTSMWHRNGVSRAYGSGCGGKSCIPPSTMGGSVGMAVFPATSLPRTGVRALRRCFPLYHSTSIGCGVPSKSLLRLARVYRIRGACRADTRIGQSTCIVQMHGITVLTDPIFGDQPLASFLSPSRMRPMPCAVDTLRRVDVVLVSHKYVCVCVYADPATLTTWISPLYPRFLRRRTGLFLRV